MPKFTKEILTEGLYATGDGNGGRQVTFVPEKRIEHWVSQHAEMVAAGLKIPAPELHADDEDPNKYVTEAGSKSNFGFWEQLSLGEKIDAETGAKLATMNGLIDVPVQSDADRIGSSVQETSIYAKDEFIDGTGRVWKDVLVHISPCTKPIEPGQKNFAPVADGVIAMSHRLPIAMSDMNTVSEMLQSDSTPSTDLKSMLLSVAGIAIPDNCSMDQLEQVLLAALRQKQVSESNGEGGSVTKPPKNATVSQVPIVMSSNQNQPGATTIAPNAVPTQTLVTTSAAVAPIGGGETIPPDTIAMSQQLETQKSQNEGLMNVLTDQSKQSLLSRLNALKQRNIVNTKERYDELAAEINGITAMSFGADNKPVPSRIEDKIETLEKVTIAMPSNPPTISMASQDTQGNFVVQNNPLPINANQAPTADRTKEILDGMFGTTSIA